MRRMLATGRQKAFTLIELLVVVAILTMVASLFPFALNRALPSRRVAATVSSLVSMLQSAEAASLVAGRPVTLRLQGGSLTAVGESTALLTHSGPAISFQSSVDVSMADLDGRSASEWIVYPDGSAQAMRFEVEDSGHRGAVRVNSMTGRISVEAGH
jgi:type II secretion system protein H